METYFEVKPRLLTQSAIALGFFDGVHPGHQAVIASAVDQARKAKIPAVVATFRDHPRTIVTGFAPDLLTSLEQRLELFAKLGVDVTLALPFTQALSQLDPSDYVTNVLIGALGAKSISVGYNHHFGHNRQGNPELLKRLGQKLGFTVQIINEVFIDGIEVSSSRIRAAISTANLNYAQKLLGRPYAILGRVVHGRKQGRNLGFPTANIQVCTEQLLPASGVYAGVTRLPNGKRLPCVINLGYRPTVSTDHILSTEVHILDFDADIYDLDLSIEFWELLRAETKFDNLDDLKKQIGLDCESARKCLSKF